MTVHLHPSSGLSNLEVSKSRLADEYTSSSCHQLDPVHFVLCRLRVAATAGVRCWAS